MQEKKTERAPGSYEDFVAYLGTVRTEEELFSAKLALVNSQRSVTDSLAAVEGSYLGQAFNGCVLSQEEAVQQILSYGGRIQAAEYVQQR